MFFELLPANKRALGMVMLGVRLSSFSYNQLAYNCEINEISLPLSHDC